MITYIIKSGLCLALILLVYKVVLERERMYVFNRYYLLFGLCFAFAVPCITMETTMEIPFTDATTLSNFSTIDLAATEVHSVEPLVETNALPTWILIIISLYAIGYLLFFFRFIRNIYKIFYKIITGLRVRYKVASLVLLKENVLPHTFLHYIFLRKEAYDTQNIAEELYTHELAHVAQRHTLDIILIELIQIVFWFNPLLIYYKKAIQLNHEFLADDAVLKSNTQVPAYQQLLLENAHGHHTMYLASNLNFSVTKKRLQMMTKHTTRGHAWLMASLTIPIFITALFLFSTKVIAQETVANAVATPATVIDFQNEQDPKADYYKNVTFVFENTEQETTEKNYSELTEAEKARLMPPPSKPIAIKPSQQQLLLWQNKQKFALWLDGRVIDNKEITKHTIVHFFQSFVHKNARSQRFPQVYQTHLYTESGFENMASGLGTPLGEDVIIYIKGKNQMRLGKKKVGAVTNDSQKEVTQVVTQTDNSKGPNAVADMYYDATQDKTQRKDISIYITKEKKFLVNDNYVVPDLKKLDNVIKSELAKIKSKKTKTASIISDASVSKDFVLKTVTLLKDNNIYDITLQTLDKDDEIRLPPPPPMPPAPKKAQIKEISSPTPPPPPPPPAPSAEELKDLEIMHKIMRGEEMKTMEINGKKYYYVVKKGRKYIFNENAKMVNEKGNELPPPPPRAKKKAKLKEIKVKSKNKEKAKAKNKNKAKQKHKLKEKVKENDQ
ncbi:MAG: M56 family metallopeptidase [Bacteroidota bacterium]